jgi:hypothetical protein
MGPVRRILTFGLVWLAAAVVATVVAWQGVGLIDDQVTGDRPITLTAAEVDAALADATTGTTTASPPAPSTPATVTTGPDATASTPGPEETHTYRLTGGTTTLRFTPAGVTMVSATPEQGYQVRSGRGEGNGWRVEFEGAAGRSRIDAWWDGGPRTRIDDDADRGQDDDHDDGGDGDDGGGDGRRDDDGSEED